MARPKAMTKDEAKQEMKSLKTQIKTETASAKDAQRILKGHEKTKSSLEAKLAKLVEKYSS